jgi:hypothetical protein
MNLIRRLFRFFDRRRGPRAKAPYAPEVLFAGWVNTPVRPPEDKIRRR